MNKRIVIQGDKDNIQVALLDEQQLVEYYLERRESEPLVGSIYNGKVENVLPGMQAAFVNIGLEKNAFLYVQEAVRLPDTGQPIGKPPAIEDVVYEGQELLVQIIKEPGRQKGARISTFPTLAGRALVYMPTTKHIGISRRIEDQMERERLLKELEQLLQSEEGVIVRTVAQGKEVHELDDELNMLRKQWQQVLKKYQQTTAPASIHYDLGLGKRLVRDFVRDGITAIMVNNYQLYLEIESHLTQEGLQQLAGLQLLEEDLFVKYQLHEQIRTCLKRKVWLKSGGYLVFDQTEALLVIDVNTGKYTGTKSLEDTVFLLNLEAAKEASRQIRLRNSGGIILIDFIDMKEERHKELILQTLIEEVKKDQMRVTILGMTALGLVEMTRKKVRPSLANLMQVPCPTCEGAGYVESQQFIDIHSPV